MKHKRKGTWLMTGGLLLIAAALLLTCYNLWDERRAAASAGEILLELEPETVRPEVPEAGGEVEIPDYILDPGREMPAVEVRGDPYIGVLELPALGLELPVLSRWSYPALKEAPCRYTGSAYQGDLIIAGHNYRSHFGGLKNLTPGDTVRFRDVDGNVFAYTVAEVETLDKYAVAEMEAGDWDLTLFTCTYGGAARVTVRCTADNE